MKTIIIIIVIPHEGMQVDEASSATKTLITSKPSFTDLSPPRWLLITVALVQILYFGQNFIIELFKQIC